MSEKQNQGLWNNSGEMAAIESLNQANVSPGRGPAVNRNAAEQICQRRLFRAISVRCYYKPTQTRGVLKAR